MIFTVLRNKLLMDSVINYAADAGNCSTGRTLVLRAEWLSEFVFLRMQFARYKSVYSRASPRSCHELDGVGGTCHVRRVRKDSRGHEAKPRLFADVPSWWRS